MGGTPLALVVPESERQRRQAVSHNVVARVPPASVAPRLTFYQPLVFSFRAVVCPCGIVHLLHLATIAPLGCVFPFSPVLELLFLSAASYTLSLKTPTGLAADAPLNIAEFCTTRPFAPPP